MLSEVCCVRQVLDFSPAVCASVYVVLEILSVLSEVCCVRQVLDFSPAVCAVFCCAGDIERVV